MRHKVNDCPISSGPGPMAATYVAILPREGTCSLNIPTLKTGGLYFNRPKIYRCDTASSREIYTRYDGRSMTE